MKPTNGAQYFNIVTPGSNAAMFIGETTAAQAKVVLPTDGAYLIRTYLIRTYLIRTYLIRTYLMRSAARRNESSRYTMNVAVTGPALAALPASQDAKVAGTRFHASAELPCKPRYGAAATRCEIGGDERYDIPDALLSRG
jgi:hypothetical protein